MDSVQADALARIIDKLEREGCASIKINTCTDTEENLWLTISFKIPAEPGEQTARGSENDR